MQLSHFYAGGAGSLGMQFGPMPWWNGIERLDGFPVLIRTSSDGVTIRETTLTVVREQQLDPALFTVPADYQLEQPKHTRWLPEP